MRLKTAGRAFAVFAVLALVGLQSTPALHIAGHPLTHVVWDRGMGDPYLEGNLTWNGDQAIHWTPAPASQDDQPPLPAGDASRPYQFEVDRHVSSPHGACSEFVEIFVGTSNCSPTYPFTAGLHMVETGPGPQEFTGAPLPRTLYLNVTRGIHVALFVKANPAHTNAAGAAFTPCKMKYDKVDTLQAGFISEAHWMEPQLDLELYANGKLIGGAYGSSGFPVEASQNGNEGIYVSKAALPMDPGYGVCFYKIHPEMRVLPEGTILKLKVVHVLQQYDYSFGFAGNHRSMIRLWELDLPDLIYRYPDLVQAPGADDGGAQAGLGVGFLLLPLAGAGTRGGRRTLFAVGLLLAVAMSGCSDGSSGGGPDGPGGTTGGLVDNTFVPVGTNPGSVSGTTGAIIGIVHDDLHLAIRNVHVTVIGASNFTTTDANGIFQLGGLAPGRYELKFDHVEYVSVQVPVEVKAGFVSRPTILLLLRDLKARDERPHGHDYWDGRTEKTLGGTVRLDATCRGDAYQTCSLRRTLFMPPVAGDTNVILPGTAEVEVTLNWDTTALGTNVLGLGVKTATWNEFTLAPRPPNTPFVIPISLEDADTGHALYSEWMWQWIVPATERPTNEEVVDQKESGHNPGFVTITGKIRKSGVLPLEKRHPDFWKGADSLPGGLGILRHSHMLGYSFIPAAPPGSPCLVWYEQVSCEPVTYDPPGYAALGPVPHDAKRVKIEVAQTRDTTPQFGIDVYVKTNKAPPYQADPMTLAGFTKVEPDGGGTWEKTTYTIAVKEGEANEIYQLGQTWWVAYRVRDVDAAYQDSVRSYGTNMVIGNSGAPVPADPYLSYTFTTTVYKNP